MPLENLEKLVKVGELKFEPRVQAEFCGMVESAKSRLKGSLIEGLAVDSCFSLAYNAAHTLALAAMRWHGYRSENRYLVFQCLQHTVGLDSDKLSVLAKCYKQCNRAEHEGYLEVSSQLLEELVCITEELLELVEELDCVVAE